MTIKNIEEMSKKIEVDLAGPEGNAFALMGLAKNLCRQLHMDDEKIISEMQSGNYDHLVEVFDECFGDFVTLYR